MHKSHSKKFKSKKNYFMSNICNVNVFLNYYRPDKWLFHLCVYTGKFVSGHLARFEQLSIPLKLMSSSSKVSCDLLFYYLKYIMPPQVGRFTQYKIV